MRIKQKGYVCFSTCLVLTGVLLSLSLAAWSDEEAKKGAEVMTGLDILVEKDLQPLWDRHVGIVTNHTAITKDGKHITQIVYDHPKVNLIALFGPEHGIWGDEVAGAKLGDATDPRTQIPIYSLYGETHKPTPEMLEGIDLLVYDIQDVGVRFYTYISTLGLVMEAAGEQGIPVMVLDRPNPIGGEVVGGPVIDMTLKSFVGQFPIPIRYGMTVGELAHMINEEGWMAEGVKVDLEVVAMRGWNRAMWYDDTDLPWVAPSPNMPDLKTAAVYPGTCFFEGTNLSEGRGTEQPFLQMGAPWVDPAALAERMNALNFPGLRFHAIEYTPVSIPGKSVRPRYMDQVVRGVQLELEDMRAFDPIRMALYLLADIARNNPEEMRFTSYFTTLLGQRGVDEIMKQGGDLEQVIEGWEEDLTAFSQRRQLYFLYNGGETKSQGDISSY